jgi:hypothetical protein
MHCLGAAPIWTLLWPPPYSQTIIGNDCTSCDQTLWLSAHMKLRAIQGLFEHQSRKTASKW